MIEEYYDEEYWENQPCDMCPRCGRIYDHIDYECGDADVLTGRWI